MSLYPILIFLKKFFKKFLKDELLLYASGLTYHTLLTLVPILGLIISLGRNFFNEEVILQQSFLFLSKYLTAEALSQAMDRINLLLENLKRFPLGKFSLIFYFIMSIGLFFQIEEALNRIFLGLKRRSFKERLLFYWIALNLAPFLFLLPLLFQGFLKNFNYHLIFYFFFLWLFFYILYLYFPARRIQKFSALKGSFFTTLLWYALSFLFGIYIKKAIAYSKLYGSLSLLPISMLFIFLNWVIFLVGAEITYFLERKPWKKKEKESFSFGSDIRILKELVKGFYQGRIYTLEELYFHLPYPEGEIIEHLKILEKRGVIIIKEEEIFFAQPLEKIYLKDLFIEGKEFLKEDFLNKSLKELSLESLSS